jgi:ethanolamine utilization protein EutA
MELANIERKTITSVGIDIGTTTSHLVFSELVLEKNPWSRSKKFQIVERNIRYRGEIFFTPLMNENTEIDVDKLMPLLIGEYKKAGIPVDGVDTGAVIVTGESARKENAERIVESLALESGKFVAATAGPNFESVIAAYGSGAVEYSKAKRIKLIHTDIGGGSSNIAVIDNGEIVDTACINVGGRLIAFDDENRVIRLESAGMEVLESIGVQAEIGTILPEEDKKSAAEALAKVLIIILEGKELSDLSKELMMTPKLKPENYRGDIHYSFSGGVAEYIYSKEENNYNDLGRYLGERLRYLGKRRKFKLVESSERIRATVIGASEFTLQVSGSTTYRSPSVQLPIRNLPVVFPNVKRDMLSEDYVASQIHSALERFDIVEGDTALALAFHDPVGIQYNKLKTFALGLVKALENTIRKELPIVLVFDTDVGNSVGNVLKRETGTTNILSIDEISLKEGDFIDIGEPIIGNPVFPVVVKSLVFES